MADPLSITASVIGLASVGFEISKCLYELADAIGSAGEQVRVYANEVHSFSGTLDLVKCHVSDLQDAPSTSIMMLKQNVDSCEDIMKRLEALTQSLRPLFSRFRESENKLLQFGSRLKWIFSKKEKLLFYRDALSQQRLNLMMTMNAIALQTSKDRSNPSACLARSSLESTLAIQATSKPEDSHTEMLLGGSEVLDLDPPNESQSNISTEPSQQQTLTASAMDGNARESAELTTNDSGLDDTEADIDDRALVLISADILTEDDLVEIDQLEDSLEPASLPSTQEVWEEMHILTKRTIQFAKRVLDDQISGKTPPLEVPNVRNGSANSRATQPSATMSSVPSDLTTSVGADVAFQRADLNLPEPVDWVKIEDSFGNGYLCAYEGCETWEKARGFVTTIHPNFARVFPNCEEWILREKEAKYNRLIREGDFHFLGPEQNIIGPLGWPLVQPGWTVLLEFSHDDEFNRNPHLKRQANKRLAVQNAYLQNQSRRKHFLSIFKR